MPVYVKLIIYIFTISIASFAVYQVDFNKFMRIGRKEFSILLWLIISLALGYLLGSLFVQIGDYLKSI
ncbi:MAG: hypothetical protein HRT99_00405 [Mycoplasmatales bacterium]|nr:hypothetical protein [Mycoplasmatales bacterium]